MRFLLVSFLTLAATLGSDPPVFSQNQPGNDGPWNHRVLLAISDDGLVWTVGGEVLAERASVPELFAGPDGRPILLFVDASGAAVRGTLGAMAQQADGSWARRDTNLRGADPNIVRLKDGSYRGYTKERDGTIIVSSSPDGLRWERIGEAFRDERYRNSTDSDVFGTPDGWVMLISLGPRMLRCTSSDGLAFVAGEILDIGGSVSDTVKVDGGWRTFFHVNATPQNGGRMRIRSAFTADGRTWKVEQGDRVVAPSGGPASLGVADPAPVQLKDGSWLMALKSFIERGGGGGPQFTQGSGGPPPLRSPTGGGSGPREHQVHSATSKDGLVWTRDEGIRLMSASVPCVLNDGDKRILLYVVRPPDEPGGVGGISCAVSTHGTNFKIESGFRIEGLSTLTAADPSAVRDADGKFRLFYYLASDHRGDPAHGANPHKTTDGLNWTPEAGQRLKANADENFDKVAVHFSSDDGRTWTAPEVIRVGGLPEGMRFPFDPTLVPLPGGRVRLYFTGNMGRTFGRSTPKIHSAISTDGVNYTFEPGVRFEVEGKMTIDCAVALHQGVFHLFVPHNGAPPSPGPQPAEPSGEGLGYHATSKDGLNFTREEDVHIDGRRRWLGSAQSDGKLITFYGTGEGLSNGTAAGGRQRGGFWMATSEDGKRWKLVPNPPIGGGDPGAVQTRDGGLLVVITGESRSRSSGRRADLQSQQNFDNTGGPSALQPPRGQPDQRGPAAQNPAEKIDSKYKVAPAIKPGRFVTGQDADIMLGGFGFNKSGGAGILNHPTGLASDGKRLLVADRWNNRVLVWNTLPSKNSPPDLVLGQRDFETNSPGSGRNELNWPGNVAVAPDGTRLAVADTDNSRVLLWNSFPKSNAPPADLSISLRELGNQGRKMRIGWPWGVWTDGARLAVVATHGAAVLIWNSWPQRDDQAPDFVLRPRNSGTPRNITSDGTIFLLSDHNYGERSRPATMVWNTWPQREDQEPDFVWSEWFKGCVTPQKQLVLGGLGAMHVFNKLPRTGDDLPDITLQPQGYRNGDGPDCVFAGGRLYVCNYNGNNVLAWNGVPQHAAEPPAFALGTDDPGVSMWDTHFFIQNPVVATNGESLFVSSDFDRKMFVWRKLPDENIAKPDVVFQLADGPWDNALHGQTLVLGGKDVLTIWRKLPLQGEPPDLVLRRRIGSVELREVTGVALDEKFLYVADRQANRVYVWEGIPDERTEPKFTLEVSNPARMNSDGTWLTVAPFEGQEITFFRVADLAGGQAEGWLGGRGMFNLPGDACVSHGMLFVADRSFNRVHVWHNVQDALDSRPADAWLGARDASDRESGIARNKLSMPGSVAFDGTYLWVGEQKFSTRILRFSPRAGVAAAPAP